MLECIYCVVAMSRTSIEISERQREMLMEERMVHESSYGETIERLCGNGYEYITKEEAVEIANEQITERVMPEAQR